jgi:hypothetical protein
MLRILEINIRSIIMDKRTFGFIGGLIIIIGTTTYFITEAIMLRSENKRLKALKNSVNELEETASLVVAEDNETKEIVSSSLENEKEQLKEVAEKKEKRAGRMKTALQCVIHAGPSVLRFFGDIMLAHPEPKKEIKEINIERIQNVSK